MWRKGCPGSDSGAVRFQWIGGIKWRQVFLWTNYYSFSLNANDKCWLGERSIEETEKETEAKDSEFTGKKEVLPGIDTGM